jgi:transposase-like protein
MERRNGMVRNMRRRHDAAFKARAALEALKGKKRLSWNGLKKSQMLQLTKR